MAQQGQAIFTFTEPNIPNLDFSFSGLKTAILYFLKKEMDKNPQFIQQNIYDLCASVQQRIVSILMNKLSKAVDQYDIREVALAGGVAANSALRKAMADKRDTDGWNIFIPKISYCTDNAAMIGQQAYFKYKAGLFADQHIQASAKV
jgi:N6-L-threonylcarbamoyladenine synthase